MKDLLRVQQKMVNLNLVKVLAKSATYEMLNSIRIRMANSLIKRDEARSTGPPAAQIGGKCGA